jgi:hypothetical protein
MVMKARNLFSPCRRARGGLAMLSSSLLVVAFLASACGGAGKPQFPHLRTSGEPTTKITGVTAPPAHPAPLALENIAADYLAPAQDDVDLRPGGEEATVPIRVDEYTDAAGAPAVHVQHLSYANLGLWLLDNTFDDDGDGTNLNNADDGLHYDYRLLDDNRVSSVPTSGSTEYEIEADIVYKGERFYPDTAYSGSFFFTVDFAAQTIIGALGIEEGAIGEPDQYGGGIISNGGTIPASTGLELNLIDVVFDGSGAISGKMRVGLGDVFFDPIHGREGPLNGAFFDAADYDPSTDGAPAEVGGAFQITDSNGEIMRGGFLGVKQ